MSVLDLLHELQVEQIKIWVDGDKLRYKTASGQLPAELRAKISEQKAGIINYLQQISAEQDQPEIKPVSRERRWPLSFAQQRLWFLHQYDPTNPAYHMHMHLHVHGPLDVAALQRSIDSLVNRHEILRTTIALQEDEPVQVIEPVGPGRVTIDYHDRSQWATMPNNERTARLGKFLRAEGSATFDMEKGPLFRVVLAGISAQEHGLLIARHHIITDARSNSLLWQELTELYNAEVEGRAHRLTAVPLQNVDFSVWQREHLQGETLERELDYWRRTLADSEPLNLPTDHPHPPTLSYKGAAERFTIAPKALEELRRVGASESATLFMSLLTVFYVLLHRYTGQQDIAIGTPIDNRSRTELEGVMGLLLNTLVLRARPQGSMSFRQLLRHVHALTLDAYQHQQIPFEKLVEELRPPRLLNRHPLFQVIFTLDSDRGLTGVWEKLRIERLRGQGETAKFDLSLHLFENDDGIRGQINYATDLFDAPTIQRMAGHFQTLLKAIVANPDCPIDALPLLTEAERQQILTDWNQTQAAYSANKSMQQLFHEQATQTPTSVAIRDGERRVTYGEVEEATNRLAHHLIASGVQPGEIIGVAMERSVDAILSMLAILKAGAVYAPLDLASPPARLQGMIREAGLTRVISHQAHSDILQGQPCQLHMFEALDQASKAFPIEKTTIIRGPGDPAYVMYTSGSTGRPKGVLIPQRAVTSLVRNTTYISLTPSDVVAHASNLAFDASTFELWGALLNGASLALLSRETLLSASNLSQQIRHLGVSTLFLTTALFDQLIDEDGALFAPLKNLLFGGEAVSPRHVLACQTAGAPKNLLHVYGPTETTTFATWHPVTSANTENSHIPIGRPLTNKQTYILDNHQRLVPIGIPGELYVGGAGLALGYLNRPALTAERFIPNPFSAEPGARLYRTGDLARYQADGTIEFLGRVDRQVKIRGFRVEPGEIETILCEHPHVHDAIVDVIEHENAGKQLIAWWTAQEGATTDAASLRDFLRQHLPNYMLPVAFVPVDSFPLNANGKVDFSQLPLPDPALRTTAMQAPNTPLERQLLAIWRKVLQKNHLGVDDDFFDAGGHSLLAVRLMSKVSQESGQELPVATLFYGPTIRQQAALIKQNGWSPPWVSLVPVQPGGERTPLFLIPPAASSGIRFARLAGLLDPDQPVYSFDPPGFDGKSPPLTSVEEIATHYVRELRLIQPHGPYLLGGMCFGAHVALEMAQQLQTAGEPAPLILAFDASQPANGPTWFRPKRNLRYYIRQFFVHAKDRNVVSRLRNFLRYWQRLIDVRVRHLGVGQASAKNRVWTTHVIAQLTYHARLFNGKVILFQSAEYAGRHNQDRWRDIALNGTEIITFPDTTHRSLLLEDDNIGRIAEKLRDILAHWIDEHGQVRPE